MNINKSGSFYKLLAFALLVLIFALLAVIAVSGKEAPDNLPEQDGTQDNGALQEKPDQNGQINEEPNVENEPVVTPPAITYYLTGMECTEAEAATAPYAIICASDAPSYGISSSELVIEIPLEDGGSRFVAFHSSLAGLGKIGALAPSRGNIAGIVNAFGGVTVALGSDDALEELSESVDLDLGFTDYYYKENTKDAFTTDSMIRELSAIRNPGGASPLHLSPFSFVEYGESYIGIADASSIVLPYSEINTTTFIYDTKSSGYILGKSGSEITDLLSAKSASFENVFVLFADSTTYERSSGVQTVIATASSGSGYYFSRGKATEIRWQVKDGNILFTTLDGTELTVNRGKSFIGYYKSSSAFEVSFE